MGAKVKAIAVAAGIVMAGLVGYVIGADVGASGPATSPPESGPDEAVEPASPARPAGVAAGAAMPARPGPPAAPGRCDPAEQARLAQQVQQLESKLGLQQTMLEGYKVELYGRPIPWPDALPDQYRPEQFQANLGRAIEEVEAPVELVGFDCSEPPCIAKLRMLPGEGGAIERSEIWSKLYGANISSNARDSVDCGDGREERIRLMSPAWDFKSDPSTMTKDEFWQALRAQPRDDASKNQSKRLRARWDQIKDSWRCVSVSEGP